MIIEVTIYLKNKLKPLCTGVFNSETLYEKFVKELNDYDKENIVFGEVIFNKREFKYAKIKRRKSV